MATYQYAPLRAVDPWPVDTLLTDRDVIVNGRSLWAEAQPRTPFVRVGEMAGDHASHSTRTQRFVTLVATRVTRIDRLGHGELSLNVDANLERCIAHVDDARVIGRVTERKRIWARIGGGSSSQRTFMVPRDLAVGDLLVIPIEGTVTLSEVRCKPSHTHAGEESDDDVPQCCRHTHQ